VLRAIAEQPITYASSLLELAQASKRHRRSSMIIRSVRWIDPYFTQHISISRSSGALPSRGFPFNIGFQEVYYHGCCVLRECCVIWQDGKG
jgi:hypothetical protein